MALRRVLEDRPDVVLVDVSSREGMEVLRALGEQAADVRVVAVAVSGDASDVLECAQAGVAGYVTADASLQELLSILRSVMEGELRCLPLAAAVLRQCLAAIAVPQTTDDDPRLTGRELEIARLLAQDLANKDIARRLHIEVSTVKSHVHKILEKLHISRRIDAAASLRSKRATHVIRP
jgi:two-component system, NarL family, nitrate/nitrite response regulator NarL